MEKATISEQTGHVRREKWQEPELVELDLNNESALGSNTGAGGDGSFRGS